MTKEEIIAIADKITVVSSFKDPISDTIRYAVQGKVDPFKTSCIWDSALKDKEAIVKETFGSFPSVHTCGHPVLFKPSLAEIIEYMPAELHDKINAVEITKAYYEPTDGKHHATIVPYVVEIIDKK